MRTYCGDGIVQGDDGEACDEGDGRNGNTFKVVSLWLGSYRAARSFYDDGSSRGWTSRLNESQREVTLTRGYYMMAHEVTQMQCEERMGYNPTEHGYCTVIAARSLRSTGGRAYCQSTQWSRAICPERLHGGYIERFLAMWCRNRDTYSAAQSCQNFARLPTEAE